VSDAADRPDADDLLADPPPSWIVEHAIGQLGQRRDAGISWSSASNLLDDDLMCCGSSGRS